MKLDRRMAMGGALAAALGTRIAPAHAAVVPEAEKLMDHVMEAKWAGTTLAENPFNPGNAFKTDVTLAFNLYVDWTFSGTLVENLVANNYRYRIDQKIWGRCWAYPGVAGIRVDGTQLIDPNQLPTGVSYSPTIGNLMVYNDPARAGRLVLRGTMIGYLDGVPVSYALSEVG